MTALHWTVFTGNIRLMQLLLLKGARLDIRTDKSSKEEMPLHIAASLDHVDRARTLISGGADINARSGLDETPLHIAVNHNAKQILALLLAQSPAPQILKDWGGRSPLDLARDQGKQEMAEMIEARLQQVREAEMLGSIVGTDCRENNI
jgi:ankyrin repeat protein